MVVIVAPPYALNVQAADPAAVPWARTIGKSIYATQVSDPVAMLAWSAYSYMSHWSCQLSDAWRGKRLSRGVVVSLAVLSFRAAKYSGWCGPVSYDVFNGTGDGDVGDALVDLNGPRQVDDAVTGTVRQRGQNARQRSGIVSRHDWSLWLEVVSQHSSILAQGY